MDPSRRLKICYLVPGHDLMSSMGPTRNVLNLARSLENFADVTVAFRRLADRQAPAGLRYLEIEPGQNAMRSDDAATTGMGYLRFLKYLLTLRRFAAAELGAFDVVLEKSWLLSGYVAALCTARGQLGVPVENIVQNPGYAARRQLMKLLRMHAGGWVARRSMRKARLVIAETDYLKTEIHEHWGVPLDRIRVVHLGVDKTLFHPIDQQAARRTLGLPERPTILTYVGVLDWTHDLAPVIAAMARVRPAGVELHIVGDGARRPEYQAAAASLAGQVRFHGRVDHSLVPQYIAAADLCLAPYDSAAFASGELGYSTMKIPEYLAVGRPVASVPAGRIRSLVSDGESGFLFGNDPETWSGFLQALPSRDRLREMGRAAAAANLPTWDATAAEYYRHCAESLGAGHRR